MKILLSLAALVIASAAQAQTQNVVDTAALVQQLQRNNDQLAGGNQQNVQNINVSSQAAAELKREPDLGRSTPSGTSISLMPPHWCTSKAADPSNDLSPKPKHGCYIRR